MADQDLNKAIAQLNTFEQELQETIRLLDQAEKAYRDFAATLTTGTPSEKAIQGFKSSTPSMEAGQTYSMGPNRDPATGRFISTKFTATQQIADEFNKLKTTIAGLDSAVLKATSNVVAFKDNIRQMSGGNKALIERELYGIEAAQAAATASPTGKAPISPERAGTSSKAQQDREKAEQQLARELDRALKSGIAEAWSQHVATIRNFASELIQSKDNIILEMSKASDAWRMLSPAQRELVKEIQNEAKAKAKAAADAIKAQERATKDAVKAAERQAKIDARLESARIKKIEKEEQTATKALVTLSDTEWEDSQRAQKKWGEDLKASGGDVEVLRAEEAAKVAWDKHIAELQTFGTGLVQKGDAVLVGMNQSSEGWKLLTKFQQEQVNEMRAASQKQEKADKVLAQAKERAAKDLERLNAITKNNPQLREALLKGGFTPDRQDFKISQTVEPTSGIRRTDVQYYDALSGAIQKTSIVQNKYNKVLTDTQKRFRDLGSAITRDITEVFKWSIAVAVVYAPLQKLQELIKLAIENEAQLADIAVVLGKSHAEMGDVFKSAANAAQEMGESLTGVLESYELAYRAAGKYTDSNTRAYVANELLKDSLLLSKLAGIEQSQSLDILVGALQQLGKDLTQGEELVNKWVAVSKVANVSVEDLATSFGITATAADNVGLSVDQLNGLVASLATAMGDMSSTEVGNAIRAFTTGFQSEGAIKALGEYGIAVEDSTGKSRDFMTVIEDVGALMDAGLISDAQMNKLATALGGQGARRGPQMAALIKETLRSTELAKVSEAATEDTGEAYDALGYKLDTVETKLTQMSNAFQTLAESLGSEGGILDVIKTLLDMGTDLVEVLADVTKAIGPAAPFLSSVGIISLLAKNKGTSLTNLAAGGLSRLPGMSKLFSGSAYSAGSHSGSAIQLQEIMATKTAQTMFGIAALIPQLIGIAKQSREGENVTGELIGTGVGAVAGGVLGAALGVPQIGIALGGAIGNTFVDTVLEREGDFGNLFNDLYIKGDEVVKEEDRDLSPQEIILKRYREEAGGGSEALGNIRATGYSVGTEIRSFLDRKLGGDFFQPTRNKPGEDLEYQGMSPDQAAIAISVARNNKFTGTLREQQEQFEELYIKMIQELEAEAISALGITGTIGESTNKITSVFTDETKTLMARNASNITKVVEQQKAQLLEKLLAQEISSKEYQTRIKQLEVAGVDIVRVYQTIDGALGQGEKAFKRIANVVYNSTEDQIKFISSLVTEIADYENQIAKLRSEGKNTYVQETGLQERQQLLKDSITSIESNIAEVQIRAKLKPIIEFDEVSFADFNKQLELAYALQKLELIDVQKLTPEEAQILIDSYEPFFVKLQDGYKEVSGIGQDYLKEAGDMLSEAGQTGGSASPFNVQQIDATSSAFTAAYNKMFEYITSQFPQYKPETNELGIIFNDKTDVLHLDNLIMQLAMQELIDVNKKQLDGLYNLPTDADFFVPIETLEYAYNAGQNKLADTGATGPSYAGTDYAHTPFGGDGGGITSADIDKKIADAMALASTTPPAPGTVLTQEVIYTLSEEDKNLLSGYGTMSSEPYVLDKEEKELLSGKPEEPVWQKLLDFFNTFLYGKGETKQSIENKDVEDVLKSIGKTGISKEPLIDVTPLSQESTSQAIVAELKTLNGYFNPSMENPSKGLDLEKSLPKDIQKPETASLGLNLDMSSNISLIVDGRILATAVSQYLYEELLKFADVAGSLSRRIIV